MVLSDFFLVCPSDQIINLIQKPTAGRVNKWIDWNVLGWLWLACYDLDMNHYTHIANIYLAKLRQKFRALILGKSLQLAFNCLYIFDLISGSIMYNTPLVFSIHILQWQFCPPTKTKHRHKPNIKVTNYSYDVLFVQLNELD